MKNLSSNTEEAKLEAIAGNTEESPTSEATTMADCYRDAFATELNKLSKDAQELLLRRMKNPEIVRGVEVWDVSVNSFVKSVDRLAEQSWALREKKIEKQPAT